MDSTGIINSNGEMEKATTAGDLAADLSGQGGGKARATPRSLLPGRNCRWLIWRAGTAIQDSDGVPVLIAEPKLSEDYTSYSPPFDEIPAKQISIQE